MPGYGWLAEAQIDGADVQARMRVLRRLGDPYSDEEIEAVPEAVKDKSELDAIVAYLQGLGVRTDCCCRCGGNAMSPIWGHAIGVFIVLLCWSSAASGCGPGCRITSGHSTRWRGCRCVTAAYLIQREDKQR